MATYSTHPPRAGNEQHQIGNVVRNHLKRMNREAGGKKRQYWILRRFFWQDEQLATMLGIILDANFFFIFLVRLFLHCKLYLWHLKVIMDLLSLLWGHYSLVLKLKFVSWPTFDNGRISLGRILKFSVWSFGLGKVTGLGKRILCSFYSRIGNHWWSW